MEDKTNKERFAVIPISRKKREAEIVGGKRYNYAKERRILELKITKSEQKRNMSKTKLSKNS